MTSAILAWDNKAAPSSTIITPSTEVATLPAENLKDPHIAKKWRTTSVTSQYLRIDMASAQPVQVVALIGTNLTAAATWRVRASSSDPLVATGIVYDSGTVSAGIDTRYGLASLIMASEISARYWKIDLTDSGASGYLQAGRLFMGPMFQPKVNYSYNWSVAYIDPSRKNRSRGGQLYTDIQPMYRAVAFKFDFLTQAEALNGVLEIDRNCGLHRDLLALLDVDGSNRSEQAIWGTLESSSELSNPSFGVYSKAYRIEERL